MYNSFNIESGAFSKEVNKRKERNTMKIDVLDYIESDGGGATISFDMDSESINFFAKIGITTALTESLNDAVEFHGKDIDSGQLSLNI